MVQINSINWRPIMANKTKEDSQKTRNSILDAAVVMFAKKGFSYVTMMDIADQARISRGAVYGHYKSKLEVAVAMVNRAFDSVKLPEKEPSESCLDFCYRLGLYYLHLAVDPSELHQVLFTLYTKIDEDETLRSLRREWETDCFNHIKHWLGEAIVNNELPANTDVEFAAVYLQALSDGIFSMVYFYNYGKSNQWQTAEQLYQVGFDTIKASAKFRY